MAAPVARAMPAQPAVTAPLPATPGGFRAPLPATRRPKAPIPQVVWTPVAPVDSPGTAAPAPPPTAVAAPSALALNSNPDLVVSPKMTFTGKRRSPWYSLAVAAVTVVLIAGGVLVVFLLLQKAWQSHDANESDKAERRRQKEKEEERKNADKGQAFYLKTIPEGYTDDSDVRRFFSRKERKFQGHVDRTDNVIVMGWSHKNPMAGLRPPPTTTAHACPARAR